MPASTSTHWEKAKEKAKASKVKVGSDRYWKIVTAHFKKMRGDKAKKP